MERSITLSEETYTALQHQASQRQQSLEAMAESWLKQHLALESFFDLEWRQAEGGWRVGIKDSAVDVYTVVGYSQAGFSPQEIAGEMLPQLSLDQVRSALNYYAEYPDEIDQTLAESEPEVVKARLYRTLGPKGYLRLTGESEEPPLIRESRARYETDEQD